PARAGPPAPLHRIRLRGDAGGDPRARALRRRGPRRVEEAAATLAGRRLDAVDRRGAEPPPRPAGPAGRLARFARPADGHDGPRTGARRPRRAPAAGALLCADDPGLAPAPAPRAPR